MKDIIHAGIFELHGIGGVSLARGKDVAGIRLAFPHVSLGLCDDQYLVYLLRPGFKGAPGQEFNRYSFNLPVTEEAVRKIAGQPIVGGNRPAILVDSNDEVAAVTVEWRLAGDGCVEGRYYSDKPARIGIFVNS